MATVGVKGLSKTTLQLLLPDYNEVDL